MNRLVVLLCLCLMLVQAGYAQVLPNHTDPGARDEAPDVSGVPALRFLTSTDFPPFNYRDDKGALVGFHIDLAKAICTTLDISCTMQAWPWEQAADALETNQGDVLLAGLVIDEATAEKFDFSTLYLALPGRFVGAGDGKGFDPAQLDGKTIAVRKGSAHQRFIDDFFPAVKISEFETEIAALNAMSDGQVDYFFGDAMRASYWLNENPACCSFVGDAYFNPGYFGEGLAAAIPAGRGTVRRAVNYALQRLKRDGKLDELYLRWFPVSFY